MSEQNKSDRNEVESERLRALLLEDGDSPDEAAALLDVVNRIKTWAAPQVTPEMTAQLVEKLLPEMPAGDSWLSRFLRNARQWWPLLLICAQIRVVKREIWAASALVMALGTLVTIGTYNATASGIIPIAMLAPVVAAVGVALLYDAEYEQMLEIEDTTAASGRIILLARLTLVFGFDLILALAGSVTLAIFHADVLLWPLVMSWLAPMAFLSALAFLLSVALSDALVGSALGLMVWGLHISLGTVPDPNRLIMALSLPILSLPEYRPLLLLAAGLLVMLALWLVGQHERRLGDVI